MRSVYLAGACVLTLGLALPAQAQKQKQKPQKGNKAGQTLEAENVLKAGNFVGRLASVSGSLLTLHVEYNTLEWKKNARATINSANRQNQQLSGQLNRLGQLQNQAMNARSAKQYNGIMRQINNLVNQIKRTASKNQQTPYQAVTKKVNVNIEMSPDVKIRTKFLPFAYDDMGEPKKYTREELKELKGPNAKALGYKAELDALKVGQDIQVTLAKVKDNVPGSLGDDKTTETKDSTAKTPKTKPQTRLLATKVLILKESNQPASTGTGKHGKRRKK